MSSGRCGSGLSLSLLSSWLLCWGSLSSILTLCNADGGALSWLKPTRSLVVGRKLAAVVILVVVWLLLLLILRVLVVSLLLLILCILVELLLLLLLPVAIGLLIAI